MTELIDFFSVVSSTGINKVGENYEATFESDPNRLVTALELSAAKKLKLKADIDDLTAAKIAAIFGLELEPKSSELLIKQINASARVSDLQQIVISGGSLSVVETAERDAIQAIWNRVKELRAYGAGLEVTVASADPDTFDINAGWPE